MKRHFLPILFVLTWLPMWLTAQQQTIRVGAKHFNEGYILSEMIALVLEDGGFPVERKFNLGGTAVTYEALRHGAIDVYPEYTGTITAEILKRSGEMSVEALRTVLRKENFDISSPYGFNNTYALVMDSALAAGKGIHRISDLKKYPDIVVGLSYEFLKRVDGWDNLAKGYHLGQKPTGLEHGLAYQALLEKRIDVTDAYSTDGELSHYHLALLKDDLNFFPQYQAVSFYNASFPEEAKALLNKLSGVLTENFMQELNASALFDHTDHRKIAREFLLSKNLIGVHEVSASSDVAKIFEKAWVHIQLTLVALLAAILFALPLAMTIYRHPGVSKIVLYVTGILQTIPSIALLALLIPLVGIGMVPAVIALFLYALLPILRNAVIGLSTVDPQLKKVAAAIGLTPRQSLFRIEVPLAMPSILSGIRIAAVINVGTATLAAFIGAGGLGEFIVTGLALNNTSLILKGAIPAALLAMIMELAFEGLERWLIPAHLRQKIL